MHDNYSSYSNNNSSVLHVTNYLLLPHILENEHSVYVLQQGDQKIALSCICTDIQRVLGVTEEMPGPSLKTRFARLRSQQLEEAPAQQLPDNQQLFLEPEWALSQ